MKTHSYIILLFLICANHLLAQNWTPIATNGTTTLSNYQLNNHLSTLKITHSTTSGTDTIYHFNTHSYTENSKIYTYRAHFLEREMVKSQQGIYHFYNPDSFSIHTQANLGDQWEFNASQNDTASIVLVYQSTVLGQTDSIKVIALSSGDSILLSQNFGIVSFPDTSDNQYQLVGIEYTPTQAIGVQIANTHSIYDFNIGDVFAYHTESVYGGGSQDLYEKRIITSKQIFGNGYYYDYSFQKVTVSNYPGTPAQTTSNQGSTGAAHYYGSWVDQEIGSLSHTGGNNYILYRGGITGKSRQAYQFQTHYGDSVYAYSIAYEPYAYSINNCGIIEDFSAGSALVTEQLVGSFKNSVLQGDTAVFSSFFPNTTSIQSPIDEFQQLLIFPQPANTSIHINLEDRFCCQDPINISIWSIDGQKIKEVSVAFNSTILVNVRALPKGIYVIKLETTNIQFSKRLVIHR